MGFGSSIIIRIEQVHGLNGLDPIILGVYIELVAGHWLCSNTQGREFN
jgi:hypothetical protein